jgi:POT family proton-dependent oligopeptide transporter
MAKTTGEEIQDPRAGGSVVSAQHGQADALASGQEWFGHPRGLSTLFFTEMWERFSYYGMRAILVLFMTAAITGTNAGLGLQIGMATAIYGLYTFFVYVLSLPGGWVADNIWGQKRAVFVGGVIIMLGHVSLAVPSNVTFYLGLALVVVGTGLLKPNVSTMVGDLYPEGGARRDAGFSIFYMGINIGALAGTALVGLVGENYNFHWGFSLAAVGMFLGLVQYKLGWKYLGTAGDLQTDDTAERVAQKSRNFYIVSAVFLGVVMVIGYLLYNGLLPITIEQLANYLGYIVVALAVLYFTYLTLGNGWMLGVVTAGIVAILAAALAVGGDELPPRVALGIMAALFLGVNFVRLAQGSATVDAQRLLVIFWLFILAAVFWMGFEQAGSSMNLFARDLTDRDIAGWTMPASWLQNVNPFFIIVLAPVFGGLWVWLSKRNANPSIPVKFGLGLFGLAVGFFVLAWGAANATPENPVSPSWLIVTYFFHTAGELCLSPVGLSSMTKLAPRGRVGQMMGIWFIAAALGNLFAGLTAGQLETLAPSALFWNVALIVGGAGIVALLASPFVKRLMGDIE